MNSALKPVLPQPGVPQPSGQASPAKANVATANHAVAHPQGAQNSLHHASNNLAVQNLSHHVPNPPVLPAHAVPSMAPVSANMAQMAQNMSHHGNLSHISQNSMTPANTATSPTKSANTSAPLSLVQDKANPSQPLALTRTLDKKESETNGQSNGTMDVPKPGVSASGAGSVKPSNPEPNKDKQDIAKTSPSTPKPPEKQSSAPSTPQKTEPVPATQPESPVQSKVVTGNESAEKTPVKSVEPKVAAEVNKPSVTADVAPSQSDKKPVPEAANESQKQDVPLSTPKREATPPEKAKLEVLKPEVEKPDEKKEDSNVEPTQNIPQVKKDEQSLDKVDNPNAKNVDNPTPKNVDTSIPKNVENPNTKIVDTSNPKTVDNPKSDGSSEKLTKTEDKIEDKKVEPRTNTKVEPKPLQKSTMKLATVTTPIRKRRQPSPPKISEVTPAKKSFDSDSSTPGSRSKRNRTQVQLYQSPTPELTMATKLSASAGRSTPTKPSDDKLIVFYKNEYLAVRNTEGGFYVCQTMQNVYRATSKIKIRWLSQDKTVDPSGQTYKPDFYDTTDKECVLTTLSLSRSSGSLILRPAEQARVLSILKRALSAEQGGGVTVGEEDPLNLTEEHPDGLDLSLYKDESQLDKKSRKRNSSKSSPRGKQDGETVKHETPSKKAKTMLKNSPKTIPTPKLIPKQSNNKRGSTPSVGNTSKTATAVTEKGEKVEKSKQVKTPIKKTLIKPVKVESPSVVTPTRAGRRATKENKPSPIVPTPSTSTGKTTRTPRKPPAKK